MPAADITINEIKGLEDTRYRAMIDGDTAVLDALCSDDLIHTHSKGDHDDKRSYLHKVGSRHFIYLEITHPVDRILVVDGAALVTGRMTAKVSVAGRGTVHVDNRANQPTQPYGPSRRAGIADGQTVLLTFLAEGQQATVLQLPAAAVGTKAPQRVAYV